MKSSTVRVVQQHLCQCMEYRIRYVCDGSHAVHLIQRIIRGRGTGATVGYSPPPPPPQHTFFADYVYFYMLAYLS